MFVNGVRSNSWPVDLFVFGSQRLMHRLYNPLCYCCIDKFMAGFKLTWLIVIKILHVILKSISVTTRQKTALTYLVYSFKKRLVPKQPIACRYKHINRQQLAGYWRDLQNLWKKRILKICKDWNSNLWWPYLSFKIM